MADQTKDNGKGKRSDRTTVGLAADTVTALDALAAKEVARVREAGGIGVAPTRGQIIEALVRNASADPAPVAA